MAHVEYWYSDDAYCRAETSLRRAIGQYAYRNSWLYIGLTQQKPEERFRQHQAKWATGHQWDKMIVIYCAKSFSLMCQVEDRLIKYAHQQIERGNYSCQLVNEKYSQRPMISKNKNSYWIYVLVQQ
jgi:predicted GIY-YIG superfamily endonuclease